MSCVLILSIGPVQEFIASGRKCRDLWFGSWLLSELSFAAAQAIEKVEGQGALIFPAGLAAIRSDKETNVANKIVAWVLEPRTAAALASEAVTHRLEQLSDQAFERVGRDDPKRAARFDETRAREQVKELIECLWVYAGGDAEGGYAQARAEAERLMAARKCTKVWSQPTWAATVPKSSLDGVRESVLHESLFDEPRGAVQAALSDETVRALYGVHAAERLCGVGLLKRFGRALPTEPGDAGAGLDEIFSTTHVAALPFLDGLGFAASGKGKEAFEALVCNLRRLDERIVNRLKVVPGGPHPVSGKIDGALLFPARLREAVEDVTPRAQRKEKVRVAEDLLQGFLRKWGEPAPYFAVLLADGDHMGKAIDQLQQREGHRELSEKLQAFAGMARAIVSNHGGALIYSGGDDVLAFAPVHKILDCAAALADQFAALLTNFKIAGGGSPTLSLGVVLAHALMPLDDTLAQVRAAEKEAKTIPGKNAICLRVAKRGGEPVEIAGPRSIVVDHLREFVRWHREGELSSKAQYELMNLQRLAEGDSSEAMRRLVETQTARVIDRRRARGGADLGEEKASQVHDAIRDLGGAGAVGRALYVAQLVSRAMEQAEPNEDRSR